jgi:3'-5' exoribonuclease
VVDQNREKLRYWPAAASFHHSERGGLAHHTATMLKAAQALLSVYDFLDADLLLGGVIIHDICKIEELDASELGLAGEYTKKGLLLGHISMGVAYITGLAKELGVDDEIALLMAHMVLSHHSEPEYGSPRRPMFPEAELLHYLDTIDARMYDMSHAIAGVERCAFTGYIRSLENRKLYHHSKFSHEKNSD